MISNSDQGSVAKVEDEVTMSDEGKQGTPTSVDLEQLWIIKGRTGRRDIKKMKAKWDKHVAAFAAQARRQMERVRLNRVTSWKDKRILSKISVQSRRISRSEMSRPQFKGVSHPPPPVQDYSLEQHIQRIIPVPPELQTLEYNQLEDAMNSSDSSALYKDNYNYGEIFYPPPSQFHLGCLMFNSLEELKYFNLRSEHEFCGKNPFHFRQLYIDGNGSLGLDYWFGMGQLLNRWGKEILTAMFVFEGGESIEVMFEFLIRYLSLMPNLRELAVVERDCSGNFGADVLKYLREEGVTTCKSFVGGRPLPELPYLGSVIFSSFSPAPLIEAALSTYAGSLQTLAIGGPVCDKYFGREYVDLGQVVSGRELPFTNYYCIYTDSSNITHGNFLFPNLNELRLDYFNVKEGPEVANIFKTVNSCRSSIRRLVLKIHFNVPQPEQKKDWRDLLPPRMKLELPHLECLHLSILRSKVSDVGFLFPLASLKELAFTFTMDSVASVKDGRGIIQLAGYEDRLYDSNIWTLLPDIKLVTINFVPDAKPRKSLGRRDVGEVEGPESGDKIVTTVLTRDGYRQHHNE